MSKLVPTGNTGQFVKDHQQMGEKFKSVSQKWLDQCITIDAGIELLRTQQQEIEDFLQPLNLWSPEVQNGRFALHNLENGRYYQPTDHCLTLMAAAGPAQTLSSWQLCQLNSRTVQHRQRLNKETGEPLQVDQRDQRDAQVLRDLVSINLFNDDRFPQDKPVLIRTWKDGTARAFLSEQYAILNNEWYLQLLKKVIPDGLLSHWKGDADTMYGNVLIPDTIREEEDSDFGGMISVGNSEIGVRAISAQPSVFRAICMNGCIWDQQFGTKIRRKHKGRIDWEEFGGRIEEVLREEIPLLPQGIERVLGLRKCKADAPMAAMLGQLGQDYRLTKKQLVAVHNGFVEESKILDKDAKTQYGWMNAITRAGQQFDPQTWVKMDEIAGQVASLTPNRWATTVKRAKGLDEKAIARIVPEKLLV